MVEERGIDKICNQMRELGFFEGHKEVKIDEIGDGNLNYVFRISVNEKEKVKSYIIKKALPYLKLAGESWPLTTERNTIECKAIQLLSNSSMDELPQIYYRNDEEHFFVMEDLGNLEILRCALMKGEQFPKLGQQVGNYLAKSLFFTSNYGLDSVEKKRLEGEFINIELCNITERLVFFEPYKDSPTNDINEQILSEIEKVWENRSVIVEVDKLRYIFMNMSEALIHGDLHTGSIFVSQDTCKVFDNEFTFYGPISYDIGVYFANLIFNMVFWKYKDNMGNLEYISYLKELIENTWNSFSEKFNELVHSHQKKYLLSEDIYLENYLSWHLEQSIGFGACELFRRVIGMAHVPEIDFMRREDMGALLERDCIDIAKKMILGRKGIYHIKNFIELLKDIY